MVQLFMQIPGPQDSCPEWVIVELQGDLETRHETALGGKFIGDLHYTSKGIPILIIGHHILYGKVNNLEKPFAVVTKNKQKDKEIGSDSNTMETDEDFNSIHFIVKAFIKKKIVFKTRPKPIIANVPKKV